MIREGLDLDIRCTRIFLVKGTGIDVFREKKQGSVNFIIAKTGPTVVVNLIIVRTGPTVVEMTGIREKKQGSVEITVVNRVIIGGEVQGQVSTTTFGAPTIARLKISPILEEVLKAKKLLSAQIKI